MEVNSISLELGNREKRVLVMHWKGDCKNALTYENHTIMSFMKVMQKNKHMRETMIDSAITDWNLIKVMPTAK